MSKDETSKFNFKIMNMSMDTNIPVFKESSNKQWIDYGIKNDYPQYLLDTYHNRSNKHKAIINRKARMVAGNGFEEYDNPSDAYTQFVDNIFSTKSLEEIASKLAYDLEIYGGYALKIKWSRDRTKIASVDYFPFQKVRISTDDDRFMLSKDWLSPRKTENHPVSISSFSNITKQDEPVQILYFTEDQPGLEYYPIPNYSSTLTWIDSDWEISNFHLSSIQNGFSAGFILNFATGIPTGEEMDMAYREFTRKYTGTTNAGKFILTFSEGKETAPELTPIELNTSDERFLLLSDQIKEEIFIGHEVVSPMLFGVRTEGQLGGRDELRESMELFQTTYIDYKQNSIERTLNKLGKINGVAEDIVLAKYKLFVETEEVVDNDTDTEENNIEE